MSFPIMGVVGLTLYLAALFVVAEISRRARRDLSPSDHFLAARELGVFVLFLTLYATAYSGNSLLGYPGEAYRRGFSWVMAVGFMTSIIVAFHLLVPKLRPLAVRRGFVSPGDWVRHRFGNDAGVRKLALAVALLMSVALANFLFAQLKAMGELAAQVTGGLVPYEAGVIGLALMILVYETLGGMRAVAWTDAVPGILMLVPLFDTIRESVSTNDRASAAASSFPTEDFPVQRYPIKNRLSAFAGSTFIDQDTTVTEGQKWSSI